MSEQIMQILISLMILTEKNKKLITYHLYYLMISDQFFILNKYSSYRGEISNDSFNARII